MDLAGKKNNHWQFRKDRGLYKHLRHGKRKRKRKNYCDSRGLIEERVSIEKRHSVVEFRQRIGDIEVDLILGKNHQSALLELVDRATLITILEKLEGKTADIIKQKITRRIYPIGALFCKSITFDNDKAFANHQRIRDKFNLPIFFTKPYRSQDKGTMKNRIRLIRTFLPKGIDLNQYSVEQIRSIELKINNRPVIKFDYLSPL